MMNSQLERIRLLENRMRKKTKSSMANNNEESIKSIKSTDSKKGHHPAKPQKIPPRLEENQGESSNSEPAFNMLSEEEMKRNKKITDYFTFKPIQPKPIPQQEQQIMIEASEQEKRKQESQQERDSYQQQLNELMKENHSQGSIQDAQETYSNQRPKMYDKGEYDSLKEQNNLLKEKLKVKQELLSSCKSQMLQYVIKCHKMKRNEMRQRVSNNKIRLGEYIPDKKGKEIWIDGTQIREIKEKIQAINRQKEQLQRQKKQSKKTNKQYQQDPEEWKNSIASQTYFLTREQTHYQQILKRLDEQKMLHIKEYKLLYEEEHSKYGKINPDTGVANWIKIKKYQLLGLLGKGGFSQVYKAFDVQEMRQAACKIHEFHSNWNSSAKQNYIKHALRENAVHKALCHPNIVKLYDTVEIDNNSFCTVLQYCQGPDLSYYLKKHKRIPEKQAKMIIKQVINAIRYLHSLPDKVIHYDLKPQNIMFHKGKIKITDFGLCKTTKQDVIELTSQGVGTYWYLPPECFETSKKAVITPKVDIWSIGVVYYEMLFGEKPFGDKMSQMRILNEGIMLKATTVNFPVNQKNTVSNESKQFIKDCLKANVEQRIDIWAAANHKLFEKR